MRNLLESWLPLPLALPMGTLLGGTLLACAPVLGSQELPRTVPEATDHGRTSLHGDVDAFLGALEELPSAERLERSTFGQSHEGRDLWLVRVQDPSRPWSGVEDPRLRVLVIGNIHAGEVEGKEACQLLLRELAMGEHAELLEQAVLWFVPVYNADGNEPISRANRVTQNGPDGGVGERANAQGLDLNRDFVKVESPECRALMGLFNDLDPHLFVDLHTTNGTYHGYHLTYAPSLSTTADPDLDRFARATYLPAVTERLSEEGWRIQHYGNSRGHAGSDWSTYDHRPRFGTNYYGLRGRLAVLSEAYSYLDFERRILVTRAFVLALLEEVVARREQLLALCQQADSRALEGGLELGIDTELAPGRPGEMLMGEIEEEELPGLGTRRVALDVFRPVPMQVRVAFRSLERQALPEGGWALVDPSPAVLEALRVHGVEHARAPAGKRAQCERFRVDGLLRSPRLFQGHHEVELQGRWIESDQPLPGRAGVWHVPARQRLARVAAQLLEPLSEDSLVTWNLWGSRIGLDGSGEAGEFPVLRLTSGWSP